MSGMNSLVIQGHLTRKPEIKYLPGDRVVVNCAIANNQKTGEQEKTCFLEFSIWGKQAEALANHTDKGSQIVLQGRLSQEFWQDRHTGQQRSKHVLYAQQFSFCGNKSQAPIQQAPAATTTLPSSVPQTAPVVQQPAPVAPVAVPMTAAQQVAPAQAQVAPVAAPHTVVAVPTQPAPAAQAMAQAPMSAATAPAVPERPQIAPAVSFNRPNS